MYTSNDISENIIKWALFLLLIDEVKLGAGIKFVFHWVLEKPTSPIILIIFKHFNNLRRI